MRAIVSVCLLLSGATLAWAQGSLGGLTGVISHPTRAAPPDARVRSANADTAVVVAIQAASDGAYLASGLPPGTYRITVTKTGFKTIPEGPVTVSTATVSTVNISLPVGEVTESVNVSENALQLQ